MGTIVVRVEECPELEQLVAAAIAFRDRVRPCSIGGKPPHAYKHLSFYTMCETEFFRAVDAYIKATDG